MESEVRISVVIPLFNKSNYIGRAIRSIQEQTIPCSEIIIVDDGSTDGGYSVVKHIEDHRIRLFRQANQGPSGARNKGIAEARGGLVAFLDADDEWKPGFLEAIVRLRTRYPQAGAYATAYEIQEPDGRIWTPLFREIPLAPWEGIIPNFFRSALWRSPVWTSAVVIPKEVFDTVGRFVLCSGLGQDVELWGRIALQFPIAFTWRVGSVYHMEAENRRCGTLFTHVFASDSFEQAMRRGHVPLHILPDVKEFVAHQKLIAASRYVVNGKSKLARDILRACRTRRFLGYKLWWWFWSMLPWKCVHLAWRSKQWLRKCFRQWSRRPYISLQSVTGKQPNVVNVRK